MKTDLDLDPLTMFDKNGKNQLADLSAGSEGGLLLPSGVFLPPIVLSLHLQGLLRLTLNYFYEF